LKLARAAFNFDSGVSVAILDVVVRVEPSKPYRRPSTCTCTDGADGSRVSIPARGLVHALRRVETWGVGSGKSDEENLESAALLIEDGQVQRAQAETDSETSASNYSHS
jgi:hypothetical protein